MIENYDSLPIGKYMEILAVYKGEGDELDKQVRTVSILSGVSVDDLMLIPLPEYKAMAAKTSFLNAVPDKVKHKKSYKVGGYELVPCDDYRRLTTGQYIDFQTFAPLMEERFPELLSVMLVPKGKRYNENYDLIDVQKALRESMSVSDAMSATAFFLSKCAKSILSSLNYSEKEAKKLPDSPERAKILTRIAMVRAILSRTSGNG